VVNGVTNFYSGGFWNLGTISGTGTGGHSALSNLNWTASGHTSTPARIAGFLEGGSAGVIGIGTGLELDGSDNLNVSANERVFYVRKYGNDDTAQMGNVNLPWLNVTNLTEIATNAGDVVDIGVGVWEYPHSTASQVPLMTFRSNIVLRGVSPETSVIRQTVSNDPGFWVLMRGTNITIRNLSLEAESGDYVARGISLYSVGTLNLENLILIGGYDVVKNWTMTGTNNTIRNVRAFAHDDVFLFQTGGTGTVWITDCYVNQTPMYGLGRVVLNSGTAVQVNVRNMQIDHNIEPGTESNCAFVLSSSATADMYLQNIQVRTTNATDAVFWNNSASNTIYVSGFSFIGGTQTNSGAIVFVDNVPGYVATNDTRYLASATNSTSSVTGLTLTTSNSIVTLGGTIPAGVSNTSQLVNDSGFVTNNQTGVTLNGGTVATTGDVAAKAATNNTVTINGSAQKLGDNPNFTVSSGGITNFAGTGGLTVSNSGTLVTYDGSGLQSASAANTNNAPLSAVGQTNGFTSIVFSNASMFIGSTNVSLFFPPQNTNVLAGIWASAGFLRVGASQLTPSPFTLNGELVYDTVDAQAFAKSPSDSSWPNVYTYYNADGATLTNATTEELDSYAISIGAGSLVSSYTGVNGNDVSGTVVSNPVSFVEVSSVNWTNIGTTLKVGTNYLETIAHANGKFALKTTAITNSASTVSGLTLTTSNLIVTLGGSIPAGVSNTSQLVNDSGFITNNQTGVTLAGAFSGTGTGLTNLYPSVWLLPGTHALLQSVTLQEVPAHLQMISYRYQTSFGVTYFAIPQPRGSNVTATICFTTTNTTLSGDSNLKFTSAPANGARVTTSLATTNVSADIGTNTFTITQTGGVTTSDTMCVYWQSTPQTNGTAYWLRWIKLDWN
jgi:hypothetical protein